MSKKLPNDKEIERVRWERKWQLVPTLLSAFGTKQVSGLYSGDELDLFRGFHSGEAELEEALEKSKCPITVGKSILEASDLQGVHKDLSNALKLSEILKEHYPVYYQDAQLLIGKYYFAIGEFEKCASYVKDSMTENFATLPRRSKYILAEACTCKALSLEATRQTNDALDKILGLYEVAVEISLSLILEEERSGSGTLKRGNVSPNHASFTPLSPLIEFAILRPVEVLLQEGSCEAAIHLIRTVLRTLDSKTNYKIKQSLFTRLAEIILSATSSDSYNAPSTSDDQQVLGSFSSPLRQSTPDVSQSSIAKISSKKTVLPLDTFQPQDEIEETVLLLLLCEAMPIDSSDEITTNSSVANLNDMNSNLDLLSLTLPRGEQYTLLSEILERALKHGFNEFHLYYQYALSLISCAQYSRAFLALRQCHELDPSNPQVLLFCIKLCINNLQKPDEAVELAKILLDLDLLPEVEAMANSSLGIAYSQLACSASTYGKFHSLILKAIELHEKANLLVQNSPTMIYHLSMCKAMVNDIIGAVSSVKKALQIDPTDFQCLYLLIMLLSVEKKFDEALKISEQALIEYPAEYSLLQIRIKLTEQHFGSLAAVMACQDAIVRWSTHYVDCPVMNAVDGNVLETPATPAPKSPSYSTMRRAVSESKLMTDSVSMKKVSMEPEEDGTTSITASFRIEQSISEKASASVSTYVSTPSATVAILSKLWLLTAESFINLGDPDEATGCIQEAALYFPLSPDVLYMRGRLSELHGKGAEARACYESAVSVLPTHNPSLQRLGLLYFDENDLVLAEKTLKDCVLTDVSNCTAWNDLGLVLEASGNFDESVECFLTSLKLEGNIPILPWTNLPRWFEFPDS